MSVQVIVSKDESAFTLNTTNDKTGAMAAVVIHANKALDDKALGQIIGATVKAAGTRRDAWQSFLGLIYAHPKLDGYKGQGDKTTGKVSKEFKASVRDVEGFVVDQMVKDGFIKLPKGDPEKEIQTFLSELRDDKNYSNIKVTTNRYFALCGANVVTQSGYLIPVEVMKAQINEVVDPAVRDDSVAADLRAVEQRIAKETLNSTDMVDCLAAAKRLVALLQPMADKAAELATVNVVQTKAVIAAAQSVVDVADAAFASARKTLDSVTK